MGREIVKSEGPPPGAAADAAGPPQDGYGVQLAKLVPAEAIGAFVFVDGIVAQASAGGLAASTAALLLGAMVLAGLAGTPLYLRSQGVKRAAQLVVSTLAFAVWAWMTSKALPLVWVSAPPPVVASVVGAIFVFLAPFCVPKKKRRTA